MNLDTDADFLKLLPLEELFNLLEELERRKAIKSLEYELVLKEIKERR